MQLNNWCYYLFELSIHTYMVHKLRKNVVCICRSSYKLFCSTISLFQRTYCYMVVIFTLFNRRKNIVIYINKIYSSFLKEVFIDNIVIYIYSTLSKTNISYTSLPLLIIRLRNTGIAHCMMSSHM